MLQVSFRTQDVLRHQYLNIEGDGEIGRILRTLDRRGIDIHRPFTVWYDAAEKRLFAIQEPEV